MSENRIAQKAFLRLVGAVLNNREASALPDGISANDIFEVGSKQDMAPIIFCALNGIKGLEKGASWIEHEKRFFDDCMRSEIQMSEYEELVKYLCENGVKILPLKGCVMKTLYPVPNLRVMADVDLLYEGVTPQDLSGLMERVGYSTENLERGCHDVFHKKPCMSIESHRKLVDDDSPYKSILQNMFEKAVPDDKIPNLYHMKPEDLYIHVIAHAAKHFKGSGLGVRPVGDIYVLNQRFGDSWDREYIDKQFASVGLDKFEKKMRMIAYAFFGEEGNIAEVPEMDLEFFFRGSTYGSGVNMGAWRYIAKGGKSSVGYFLYTTFLPYYDMRRKYPVLRKVPLLLPFAWVYRIIDVLLHKRQNVVRIAKTEIKEDDVKNVTQIMESFGLGNF